MKAEQAQELHDLAETTATYFHALIQRHIPAEIAGMLVRDWHMAYLQDEIDRRTRGRRSAPPMIQFDPMVLV